MNYSIKTIPQFDKQFKRLIKKHPSLKSDFASLLPSLYKQPVQGTSIGQNCYKIRLAIASKGKGKSGGARIITHFVLNEETLFLISIYDKAEQETMNNKDINELLKQLG